MNDAPENQSAALARTGVRFATALLGYFVLVTLVITLSPFDFGPPRLTLYWLAKPSDIVMNVALFLPIGFLLGSIRRGVYRSLVLACTFSIAIESAQVFLGSRYVSPIDVLTNTCGAWAGLALRDRIEHFAVWQPEVVGRMGLDVPVVGLLYLLVPQLWLSSVGLAQDAWRSVTTLMLGCAGTIVLASLSPAQDDERQVVRATAPQPATFWFVVGAIPVVAGSPRPVGAAAATVVAVTWWLVRQSISPKERRLEATTLRRFLPVFSLYLVTAALWPIGRPFGPWQGAVGFLDGLRGTSILGILFLLEQVGAFTLLGYALAEWKGRDESTVAQDLPRIVKVALPLAIALELAQGFIVGPGASVLRAVLSTVGAAYGAAVYHLARTHVQYLRSLSSRETKDTGLAAA